MTMLEDLRSAARQMRRHPSLAITIILMMGIALSAATAVFSYVDALLLRPAPWKDPSGLVEIRSVRGGENGKLTMWELEEIFRSSTTIESVAGHSGADGGYNFGGEGKPEEWRAVLTTGNLFDVLGVPLARGGRWPESADRERDFRVIISHGVWKRAFGGADVVGKTITLDHAPGYVIHGVAPEGFDFPAGVEVYRSLGGFTNYVDRTRRNVVGIARLRRNATPARLAAELSATAGRLARDFPETNAGLEIQAVSLLDAHRGPMKPYVWTLLVAVSWVLLVASLNAATLLLARSVARARELGMRVVLGARRSALARQLIVESSLLAALGGVAGIGLGYLWMRFVDAALAYEIPAWMRVSLDLRVAAGAFAAALATGIAASVVPAIYATRSGLSTTLRGSARGSSSGAVLSRLRDALVVGQIGLAFVLVNGAGLVTRGFGSLLDAERGFSADGIATFRVALGWRRYDAARSVRYYEEALEKLRATPGVEGVALVNQPPLSRQGFEVPAEIMAEGQSPGDARSNPYVVRQQVSEGYFDLVRIPILRGRGFNPLDTREGELVAVLSRGLAERLWPGEDPIGKRVRHDPARAAQTPWLKVVGIVGDVAHHRLGQVGAHEIYEPFRQGGTANQYVLARTRLELPVFRAAAERALWSIDPEQSLFDFRTYDERILAGVWTLRLAERLLGIFGAVAFLLAATGAAAALLHAGRQRTREIGIRIAMGSSTALVRRMMLRRGLGLGALGLLGGAMASGVLGALVARLLPGVPSWDPATFVFGLLLFGATLLAACARPVYEAGRVDPIVLLRDE